MKKELHYLVFIRKFVIVTNPGERQVIATAYTDTEAYDKLIELRYQLNNSLKDFKTW